MVANTELLSMVRLACRLGCAIGFLAGCSLGWSDESSPAQTPIALKILYAGNPDSDRAKDFEQLLARHFEKVEVTNYGKFKSAEASGFDVVIFDWSSTYPRDEDGTINWDKENGFSSPPAPQLPKDFDRPCVLIGAAGGSIIQNRDIAINWK